MKTMKNALVTGGGRGIGAGICEALAREGWCVAFTGRKPVEELASRLDALRALGAPKAAYFQSDVADLSAHSSLLDSVEAAIGPLSALVNNAGVAPTVRLDVLDTTPESFDRLIATNLRGPFFLTQAAARRFVAAKTPATIVNVGSISATVVSTSRGEYCISKAGVAMATQLWAARLASEGIRVYEVRPGVIRTDMTGSVREKYDRLLAEGLAPQARWGEPSDIGAAVAMLLRGDLAYSTGQTIQIDGGMTIARL
ncbi:MAG: 3-ketoacyl-ACP reductase [Kiritimatiellae bacterium]|nr:3-ketoacyl-ACP reductase [Kiritimatiellia bacterium]